MTGPVNRSNYLSVVGREWIAYYRFGKEETLAAGTRLRVFSGAASQPFSANPLETVRHAAAPFELGEVQLDDRIAELRLVEAEIPRHQREFVPDTDFSPIAARVLRRADGTSYVFVPDGGGAFPEGDYRFRLEYRRGEPGPVLSERGEEGPEIVHIDVPWDVSNSG